jgi:tetratricopeptide (TPR) repeat protein
MVRLDAKDPDARHIRDTKGQTKSDLYQIIVYYNDAIKRDPKDDDAYFHRGLAKLYAGALPAAMADLVAASRLDPQYAYYALWIDIIDRRRNEAGSLRQAAAHLDMTKWPAPVIRLFLGETTPAAVLAAAADPDPATRKGQLCEANFYGGEFALQQGAKSEATRRFRLAAARATSWKGRPPAPSSMRSARTRDWIGRAGLARSRRTRPITQLAPGTDGEQHVRRCFQFKTAAES